METFIFVYRKDAEIRVLSFDESIKQHPKMIADGFKHTQTLDACKWVEFILNLTDAVDLLSEVHSVNGITLDNADQVTQ